MEITKESSIEEAMESVAGTKTMLVMKFKKFLEPSFGLDDLFAVADEAILLAWKTWDPKKSKFNTYAHNYITWKLNKYLAEMNRTFKKNNITSYELNREGQSFQDIKESGKTKNEEFNKSYYPNFKLDGSSEAKKRINKDLYNAYIRFETSKRYPIHIINESQFKSEDSENFNIFDSIVDEDSYIEKFSMDNFSISKDELDDRINQLDSEKKKVVRMIIDGKTISDIASELGLTQTQVMQRFAGGTSGSKGKEKLARAKARAEMAKKLRAKKALSKKKEVEFSF